MRIHTQTRLLRPAACGLSTLQAIAWLTGMVGSLCLAGEATAQDASLGAPLRVGITPEYPPLVFREPNGTNGLEIDLAKALGAALNRPVKFVVLRWDEQIPSLIHNETDIIMTGMSITKARQLRIAFSDPYLPNQLRAIFRLKDAARFKTPEDILKSNAKIGVIAGTTGDIFVSKSCPNAERVPFTARRDIGYLLAKGGRMDLFVDDTFALAQMISEHEAELGYLEQPLSQEDLGWGIRQGDSEFLANVNRILAKWKADGTLQTLVDRWIPYLKSLKLKQQ